MSKKKLTITIALVAALVATISLTAMAASGDSAPRTSPTTIDTAYCLTQAHEAAEGRSDITDENGNVIGYVNPDGSYTARDEDGNPIVITADDTHEAGVTSYIVTTEEADSSGGRSTSTIITVEGDTNKITDDNGNVIGSLTDNNGTELPDHATRIDAEPARSESVRADEAADIDQITESVITVDTDSGKIADENGNLLGYVGADGAYTLTDADVSPIVITVDPESGASGATTYSIIEAK